MLLYVWVVCVVSSCSYFMILIIGSSNFRYILDYTRESQLQTPKRSKYQPLIHIPYHRKYQYLPTHHNSHTLHTKNTQRYTDITYNLYAQHLHLILHHLESSIQSNIEARITYAWRLIAVGDHMIFLVLSCVCVWGVIINLLIDGHPGN